MRYAALPMPVGSVYLHRTDAGDGVRIVFVESVDDWVLRFNVEGTDEEYFVPAADGLLVRPTVTWALEEHAAERLFEVAVSEGAGADWRDRFLGLDRSACLSRNARSVLKYDLALAALIAGTARSEKAIEAFLDERIAGDDERRPSWRSVIRWTDNLLGNDLRVGSMVNRSGRRPGVSQLAPLCDRIVHQAAALFHADQRLAKMDSAAIVVGAWRGLAARGVTGIGSAPPSKTAVVNRINAMENERTTICREGAEAARRIYEAHGEPVRITRPFELLYIDGTEYRQVCLHAADWPIPSAKMKAVSVMDAFSLFVFPSTPFAGPYRSEMGMAALLGALMPPPLHAVAVEKEPLLLLACGRMGRLRGDNDKAILPPAALGNLVQVIGRVELAEKYKSDEKSNLENYWGWEKARLDGEPGTVLSARSRRRSVRHDPLAEAALTRADFCRRREALRLEWNDTGHEALGWRSPNDVMLEHIRTASTRLPDPGLVRRSLARTVAGVLTTNGVRFHGILYRWNRPGIKAVLDANLRHQPMSKRLEGTGRCDVQLRVYDWNLDFIEIYDEDRRLFVTLWSTDPDYTSFLTRWEHSFYSAARQTGAGGAVTEQDRLALRVRTINDMDQTMPKMAFTARKTASAILEAEEVREQARNVADDPDLTDVEALAALIVPTAVGGATAEAPFVGPKQKRPTRGSVQPGHAAPERDGDYGWGGIDPSTWHQTREDESYGDDPDDGIEWDDDDGVSDPEDDDPDTHLDHPARRSTGTDPTHVFYPDGDSEQE